MTEYPFLATLLRPPTVTVHDDGDMDRYTALILHTIVLLNF